MALQMNKVYTTPPKITAAMSAYEYSEEIESLFTFESAFDGKVCGAIRQGNTLWVPREAVPYAQPPQDFRSAYPSQPIPCVFEPRHEQGELCKQSLTLLQNGINHLFEAPTGWGKTVAGSYIACALGQPTMIVVTKDDLTQQWINSLVNILKVPKELIGRVQGPICDWQDKRIVIGMAQSLMNPEKYPHEMFKYFGLLLVDEVHQMATDCFIRVCQSFTARYRLGFSATPKRKDGKTQLLHWHIGPTKVVGHVVSMKPKVLVRQTGWKIPRYKKYVDGVSQMVPIPHAPGRMMLVIKAMAKDNLRNMEIVNFVVQAYKAGRHPLILSDLREDHLDRLFLMLTEQGIPGNDIGYYVGQMKKHELEATKKRRVVLGTYKMCSTGTDVVKWDTLIMATPRADVKQSVGRVLRFADDKRQPIVLDLVDYESIFQNFHLSRLKQYYSIGAEIHKVK